MTGLYYVGSDLLEFLLLGWFDVVVMNWLLVLVCNFTVLDNVSVTESSVFFQLHHQF